MTIIIIPKGVKTTTIKEIKYVKGCICGLWQWELFFRVSIIQEKIKLICWLLQNILIFCQCGGHFFSAKLLYMSVRRCKVGSNSIFKFYPLSIITTGDVSRCFLLYS